VHRDDAAERFAAGLAVRRGLAVADDEEIPSPVTSERQTARRVAAAIAPYGSFVLASTKAKAFHRMNLMRQLRQSAGRLRARFRALRYRKPQGRRGIRKLGHREYVGGLWDEMGELQFDFLVEQGLMPSDVLLDVGCGSLRGGVHFIRYLEPGNYLGMEKEQELLQLGVKSELGMESLQARRPELLASGTTTACSAMAAG
jgi:hypothetical protein